MPGDDDEKFWARAALDSASAPKTTARAVRDAMMMNTRRRWFGCVREVSASCERVKETVMRGFEEELWGGRWSGQRSSDKVPAGHTCTVPGLPARRAKPRLVRCTYLFLLRRSSYSAAPWRRLNFPT